MSGNGPSFSKCPKYSSFQLRNRVALPLPLGFRVVMVAVFPSRVMLRVVGEATVKVSENAPAAACRWNCRPPLTVVVPTSS